MVNEFFSNNKVIIGIFIAIIIAYLLTRKKAPSSFDKEYEEILNSDKYKVKGQYEKV